MKAVRVPHKTYQYLVMQRALTGVPANRQIEILVQKEMDKENDNKKETAVLPAIRK